MDDALLAAIADRFGTPTYVYDLDVVTRQADRLRAALPHADLRFAVKANPNGAVLRHLARLGLGAEVITLGELERARRAGMAPERLLVGGPGQPPELVSRAGSLGAGLVSLDSPGQWDAWSKVATRARFLVRVNPGLDAAAHEHLATGAAGSKFGLPPGEALSLAGTVAAAGRLAGFHVHVGSMVRDASVVDAVADALAPLYGAFASLPLVDVGGGLAVPDFQLEAFAARVRAAAARLGAAVVLEPGRFLVAEAGTLLTRVLHVKEGARRHVLVDAGMADLLRPALYGAAHPARLVGTPALPPAGDDPTPATGPGALADIDGPLCENADRLGRAVSLPGTVPGALLAVAEAGAYGFAMASNYASSLRPAEVVVEGGQARLARRRERPQDLWRLEEQDGGPPAGEDGGRAGTGHAEDRDGRS